MIKYTPSNQLTLKDFSHPFDNELSPDNRWVKLAQVVPWDELANIYAKALRTDRGRKTIDIRMVIGALIVKHKLGLDDRGAVEMISENIYLQYFCGLTSFQTKTPFHPTVFVDVRKRMGAASFDKWNELVIEKADSLKPKGKRGIDQKDPKNEEEDQGTPQPPEGTETNKGSIKIDASVANQKIAYPTDGGLLNTAREESERLIDLLYEQSCSSKKPRTYRRVARKEYLAFSKQRKKRKSVVRKFIRKQLGYLNRNLARIETFLDHIEATKRTQDLEGPYAGMYDPHPYRFPLSKTDQRIYWVLRELYRQQHYMYTTRTHSIGNRIVSIYQPWVRPIVRGKDKAGVEFGAKVSASEVDGMSRVEHIGWEAFNESMDLKLQVNTYKATFGHYPELLLADRIYFNRENRKWLKQKNIRIVGDPLGRPAKEQLSPYQKRKQRKERNQRNLIEGKFGQGKNAYGLNNIQAKRKDTSESWIGAIFFVMNLITLSKIADKYAIFCAFIQKWTSMYYVRSRLLINYNNPVQVI